MADEMTPFTDDDLRRLKENIASNRAEGNAMADPMFLDDAEDLLSRLEAAEAVAAYFANHPDGERFSPYARKVIEIWLNEAGK